MVKLFVVLEALSTFGTVISSLKQMSGLSCYFHYRVVFLYSFAIYIINLHQSFFRIVEIQIFFVLN